jgi:hypothetical protein
MILQVILAGDVQGQDPGTYLGYVRRQELESLKIDEVLNILGEDGWEVAGILPTSVGSGPSWFLKRPKE